MLRVGRWRVLLGRRPGRLVVSTLRGESFQSRGGSCEAASSAHHRGCLPLLIQDCTASSIVVEDKEELRREIAKRSAVKDWAKTNSDPATATPPVTSAGLCRAGDFNPGLAKSPRADQCP